MYINGGAFPCLDVCGLTGVSCVRFRSFPWPPPQDVYLVRFEISTQWGLNLGSLVRTPSWWWFTHICICNIHVHECLRVYTTTHLYLCTLYLSPTISPLAFALFPNQYGYRFYSKVVNFMFVGFISKFQIYTYHLNAHIYVPCSKPNQPLPFFKS